MPSPARSGNPNSAPPTSPSATIIPWLFCQGAAQTEQRPLTPNQVDIALALSRNGWRPVNSSLPPYAPGVEKLYMASMVYKSASYLHALLDSDLIFLKGCQQILHKRPHFYYVCLVELNDLRGFCSRSDIGRLRNEHFKALSEGKDVPILFDDAGGVGDEGLDLPPALEDGACDTQAAGGDLELEQSFEPLALAAEPIDVIGALTRPVTLDGVVVRFDGWSHSSGHQRAYVACANPQHEACFRYRQVRSFQSRPELVAYMFAWSHAGLGLERSAHVSQTYEPEPSAIEFFLAAMRSANISV